MTDAQDRQRPPVGSETPNILLVDDLPANLLVLRTVLDGLGHTLVEANSGEEALARLRERVFAVVLLDVNMPGLDGFETARLLRAREGSRHTPVVFITAYDSDRDQVERAYALGAVDFLFKPLSAVVVQAKVAGFVDLYEKTEQVRRQGEHIRHIEQREFEQRLAEENARLRAERERFRVTLDSIGDAVVTTDTHGRVTFLNPVAEALTGWSLAEAAGRPLPDVFRIINEGTRKPVENPALRALADGVIVGLANHTLLIARDGTERPIDDSAAPIRDAGALVGAVLVFRDITARKRADDALRESEARQAAVLRASLDAIVTIDAGGTVVAFNPAAEALFGYPVAEAVGADMGELIIPPDLRAGHRRGMAHYLATGEAPILNRRLEMPARRKDGSEITVELVITRLEGDRPLFTGFVRDVTARKAAEAEARRAGDQARTILESITDGFCALDREWRFTYVNRQAEVLLGRSRDDLLGRSHWDEYPATLGTETERAYRRAVAENVAVAFEVFYPPHGRWYEVHAYPSPDGLAVYFRDATERRRAADTLRESEGRLRLLADTIPQLAWTARADGHIEWYNRRWYEYTGTTPDQMEGWGWQAVHDPVTLPAVLERWKGSIATGEPFEMVFPLRGADGRLRPFLTRVSPLRDGDARVLSWFGTNTDIGALAEAEDRLRASEARFRELADAMPQIIWTADPDGRIDYSNRRWREYTGLPEDAGNEAWSAVVHPDDMPPAAGRWAESLRSGAAFDMELRLRDGRTGAYCWHLLRTVPARDTSGAVARWYGTATDIDGQKRAAESAHFLSEASAALAAVVDYESTLQRVAGLAVPHFADWAAVDVATEGGTLRRLAVAHREPAKVRLAQELHDRYPPAPDAPGGATAVLRTGRAEIVADITDEMLLRGARDEGHLGLLRGLGLRSYLCVPLVVSGRPLGVLTFVTAESGRRYADADLALAEDLARRAGVAIENVSLYQELRAADARKDEFLALLGHELRNPLAPIRNAVQILELRGDDPAVVARARTMIGRQVVQMARLVDELLDASRIARGKVRLAVERLDLAALVRTVVEDHRAEAEAAGLAVEVVTPSTPAWVRGDPARLAQVAGNLFHNAVKFTPAGRVTVRVAADGGEAVLSVSDTGIGIEQAAIPTLFQPFRQVDADAARAKGGLGLGLAVVKGLVELHGGRVAAASDGPGRGATFTARLPLTAPGPDPAPVTPPAGELAAGGGQRVVIIEDGADTAESLRELLELRGFVVATAATGPAGVELCRRVRPAAVVCDIGLPGMSGFEVARALRADPATAGAILVAVSGYAQEEDRRKAREAGFDALLAKPADTQELVRLLTRPHA